MRTIEKISEDDSAPRGRPRTENPKQLSKQNQTHIFRNVKIPKALKPLARQSLRRMAPIQLDPEKDLDSRDVPLYRNPQGNEKISTDAVKNAEKIAKEKADEEKEKAEGRVTAEKRYYFEEDDWEDDEAYLSGSSIGPGERYAGLPRRRASNLRCHLSVDYRGAYGNGAYKPDW
jgi:hypothetical protein